MLGMPGVLALLAPGMRDDADLRHGRRIRPHHLSLPAVHFAGLALWRRAEQHRPLRPCRGHADPAQPRSDRRGAGPHALAAQQRLCRLDRRGDRRPAAMAVAADRLRARRRQHEAGAAALDRTGGTAGQARHARGHRRRRAADQHHARRGVGLAAAGRHDLGPLLRRPHRPVAAGRGRHRHRHGAAAAAGPPVARRPDASGDGQPEPRHRVRPDAQPAGGAGAVAAGRSPDPHAVRARPLRSRRHLAHGERARRLCRRPARLRPGQGADAGLLRPRGHQDAALHRDHGDRRQHRAQHRLPLRHDARPGRHRARLVAVGLAERGPAGRRPAAARAVGARRTPGLAVDPHGGRDGRHGRGSVGRPCLAGPVAGARQPYGHCRPAGLCALGAVVYAALGALLGVVKLSELRSVLRRQPGLTSLDPGEQP